MTSGERAVWAAEFVRVMSDRSCESHRLVLEAIEHTGELVRALRRAGKAKMGFYETDELSGDAREMLEDMLSTGADR